MIVSPVVAATKAVGLHPIQEYIWRRQATITVEVICSPIYELCIEAERRPGTRRVVRW